MRLQDVATIYTDPRYIFDECLAFFSQQSIALPAYSYVQAPVTRVLSNDNLVTAFCYLVTKHHESAKVFAQQKVAEELELIRNKQKHAE